MNQGNKGVYTAIAVAALGYFVDIYDLVLFGVVREASLKGLGITSLSEISKYGDFLYNWQMIGMLTGGVLWGILGDKKGRLSVLFGSIIMYSVANILNGFVTDIPTYALLRFIAGVGLAGELGAGITLVNELMSKENRGYGATIIACVGTLGAVTAGFVAGQFEWRTAYFVGGGMGLALLILRIGVFESGMFKQMKEVTVQKGNFFSLFKDRKTFTKYLSCILIGIPIWYIVGILIFHTREFGVALNVTQTADNRIVTGVAYMYCYAGLSIGDLACGLLSQYLKSRKKAILLFLVLSTVTIVYFLLLKNPSVQVYYFNCLLVGIVGGYWAMFVTVASEQFGTNIRATVTTSVPNFVRGSVVLLILSFEALRGENNENVINAALIVGGVTMAISFFALFQLKDTFGKDLNYYEES